MDKIFSFVVNIKTKKLLLLLGSDNDPEFHKSFWYVVTGAKEAEDSNLADTVKREIKEETNLNVEESIYLNWIFKYKSLGSDCIEYVYISFVEDSKVILNEEHTNYKWCDIDEFIFQIEWWDDKEFLRSVLEKGINKEKYINETRIDEFS